MDVTSPNVPPQSPEASPVLVSVPTRHSGRWFAALGIIIVAVLLWFVAPKLKQEGPAATSGPVTFSLRPSANPVTAGGEFTVEVYAQNAGVSLTAADVVLMYDAQLLTASDIKPGALLPMELGGGGLENGKATITVGSGTTPGHGDGVVAVVTFKTSVSGSAMLTLTKGTQAAASGYSGNVVGNVIPVTVTVQ